MQEVVTTNFPPPHPQGSGTVPGARVTAVIAWGKRPVPFRTRKLRPTAPMVLHPGGCGRVGHRRNIIKVEDPQPPVGGPPAFNPQTKTPAPAPPGRQLTAMPHTNTAVQNARSYTPTSGAAAEAPNRHLSPQTRRPHYRGVRPSAAAVGAAVVSQAGAGASPLIPPDLREHQREPRRS